MRLLVTNDDGINSVFLHELIAALRAAGHELYVVAPAREQSWVGAGKTKTRPVKSYRVDCRAGSPDPATAASGLPAIAHGATADDAARQKIPDFGCPTWMLDGTPSDCVNIALGHLLPKTSGEPGRTVEGTSPEQTTCVEGVVSGINVGFNCTLGFILASGTVAGAWEGALHGLPALAVSQDIPEEVYHHLKERGGAPDAALRATLKISAAHAARLAGELLPKTPPRSFIVHNLNFPFPCRPDSTMKRTVPAQFFVPGLFSPADDDGTHRLIWAIDEDVSPPEPLTDLACVSAGHISHTVLDYSKLGHS